MDIEYIIEYLIINLFFFYVLYKFLSIFFHEKSVNTWKKIAVLIFCYVINSGGNLIFHNPMINMATSILSILFISCLYEAKWMSRIISMCMIYAICISCDIAVATFIGDYIIGKRLALVNNIISYLFIFSVEIFLERYAKLRKEYFESKEQIIIAIGVPGISIAIICILVISKISMHRVIVLVSLGLLFINVLVFRLYDLLFDSYEEKYKNILLERQIKQYKNEFLVVSESQKRAEGLRHDLKHHILILERLARNKNYDEILKYLKDMMKFMKSENCYISSGNRDIDSILNYFIEIAKIQNISVMPEIKIGKEMKIDLFDINVILGNLMENAIEGALESSEKIIMLSMELDRNILYIQVKNSFVNRVNIFNDTIVTNKKDAKKHGFGLKNIIYILEKYNGLLDIDYDEKYFEVNIMIYLKEMN